MLRLRLSSVRLGSVHKGTRHFSEIAAAKQQSCQPPQLVTPGFLDFGHTGLVHALSPQRTESLRQSHSLSRELAALDQQSQWSFNGWSTFMLMNRSGSVDDPALVRYSGPSQSTSLLRRLPLIGAVIDDLQREAQLDIEYARLALLSPLGFLRLHLDMFPTTRMLLPLNEQSDSFRHVIGDEFCVSMRAGELWNIDGTQHVHGAGNVSDSQTRALLLLDVRSPVPGHAPRGRDSVLGVPVQSLVQRLAWTHETKTALIAQSSRLAANGQLQEAENVWLAMPYRFAVSIAQAFDELVQFCELQASDTATPTTAQQHWKERAAHWSHTGPHCVRE